MTYHRDGPSRSAYPCFEGPWSRRCRRSSLIWLGGLWLTAAGISAQDPGGADPVPVQEATVADSAALQEEPEDGQALRVFLDCEGRFCDFDFFRREIPYVNYTRDRQVSEVHLLITSQGTGGGGRRFTLDFIGRERFEGIDDQLEVSTRANLSEEQVLTAVARTMKQGLIRYIARTPFSERVRIGFEDVAGLEQAAATPEDDPWNFWVFRVRGGGSVEGEERQTEVSVSAGLSASRITEDLKVQLSLSGRFSEEDFEIDSVTNVKSIRRNYDAFGLIVWSLGERWAAGGEGSVTHSTFSNEEVAVRVAPAVEYNLFPYSESSRRLLRIKLATGLSYFKWIEETVFLKTEETRPDARLTVSLDIKEPWGSAGAAAEGVVLLDEPSKNRIGLFGNIEVRVFKGLSLGVFGRISRVRDQINLPAGDATPEEILTRQRELETGFEYDLSLSFSYTFGSIFSNVVNPRFGGSGRGFGRFF